MIQSNQLTLPVRDQAGRKIGTMLIGTRDVDFIGNVVSIICDDAGNFTFCGRIGTISKPCDVKEISWHPILCF